MDNNVNYTAVGVFVIFLIAAMTLSIIWLSSGFTLQRITPYMIYMTESVSGLTFDSPVEYNGVVVGSVEKIEINHKNPQLVEVLVGIKSTTPITRGTVAMLSTRGVTGITFISLKDKSTDLRPLLTRPGQKYAVIPTSPSIFMRLDTALKEATTNLRKVTETFQSLFDQQNQQSFKLILLNMQQFTSALAANSQKLNTIISNTAKASEQLEPLFHSSMGAVKTFQNQTLPTAYRILNNLDEMSRNLSEISVELKQNPAVLIRGVQSRPLGPGEK